MAATKHYMILRSASLINEEQLEGFLEDGWILLQIAPSSDGYFFYFYRN